MDSGQFVAEILQRNGWKLDKKIWCLESFRIPHKSILRASEENDNVSTCSRIALSLEFAKNTPAIAKTINALQAAISVGV